MNRLMTAALLTALALPGAALAKDNPGKGHGNGHARDHADTCPPGLAKKSPACVPPGLAKKDRAHEGRDVVIHIGDRIDPVLIGSRYLVVQDPVRYGLDPRYAYYRTDANVYRVDQETREVLALIGAVSAILN